MTTFNTTREPAGWAIIAKPKTGEAETIDHADTYRDAQYLRAEYQLAFGPTFFITMKRETRARA